MHQLKPVMQFLVRPLARFVARRGGTANQVTMAAMLGSIGVGLVVATVGPWLSLVWLLMRSPWGRVLKGIREDENAVRSLGKNVYAYKMQALIIGGVLGALAGMIFTLPRGAVQPANYGTELTFFLYTCLLLGGLGTVLGPVLGAMIFWVVLSLTQGILYGLIESGTITWLNTVQAGQLRYILVGVALMLLMIFRPQGVLGNKKELAFA